MVEEIHFSRVLRIINRSLRSERREYVINVI